MVLGYHGCSKEAAQQLLGGSPFELSNRSYDWLGEGTYFWENDIQRAYEWAKERRMDSPCVVGAVLELGNCLDLTTRGGIEAVKSAYGSYRSLQRVRGEALRENQDGKGSQPGDLVLRHLDRAVIDHLHKNYATASNETQGRTKEFDTVRAMFPEGPPLYEGAGFREKTNVQIAVRKATQILGVFRIPTHQMNFLGLPQYLYTIR